MKRITNSLANTGIISGVTSERAGSSNRHDYLWSQEYRLSTVNRVKVNFDENIHSKPNFTTKWVKNRIKHYVKGKGAQTIKTLMQGEIEQFTK